MKSIKTLVYVSCIGLTTGLVSSCNKDEIEVIEQNTSWTIDKKYIDSDIREKIGDIPTGDLIYFHQNALQLNGINEQGITKISSDKIFQLKVLITKPLEKDVQIKVVANPDALSENVVLFPEGSYSLKGGTLQAGELETTIQVEITDANLLKNGAYELPISLQIDENDLVKAAKERSAFTIKATIIESLGNIDASNNKIEGVVFNKNINLKSNESSYYLGYLTDGSVRPGSGWWRQVWESTSPNTYLQASFSDFTTIKGIIINSEQGAQQLQHARVWVGHNGKLELHGEFHATNDSNVQYIIFKEPVTTKAIVLNNMGSKKNNQVSLTEIEFIK